ncbi:hypothetical protein LHFGNBLO_003787 [Mesorhizobium sp. AR10]|uniref:hypothetical protein n=1 Tax=Mesorhizobium sp. AR10 TaxID=2865839 RepID=UPI00215FFFA2|nr:hypothetical protein [Mesorhizobium sp. AR10]UVK36824.1 hypothetical protein LHFGNBLO_003787 [Mesorhizobium sp. AR10]
MTTTNTNDFISGNAYADADNAAEVAAKADAEARATANPESVKKPAPAPLIDVTTTVRNGVVEAL